MRTENEIIRLIINIAEKNENIKAVCMNGSKVNKNVKKDKYQDFDIVYIVENLDEVTADLEWINKFGNRIITQYPEAQDLYPPKLNGQFPILMLLDDYNRIDLTLLSKSKLSEYIEEDSLMEILLDKDGMLPNNTTASEISHWINQPYQKIYDECINEFYWITTYVFKGLKRNELLYSIEHLNICREMLLKMLSWQEGYKFNFQINFGKCYKYLPNYLAPMKYKKLISTYPHLNKNEIQNLLYKLVEMFDDATLTVSKYCGLYYEMNCYIEVKKFIGYKK
ncbi:aminoglycoside 6-adenylyltransferase [Staphylococcus shinii]|uniref:aminoglycoside 6-adenylyltransferase n=1 Tax=Staphylococcus shinii TaxID=2912228 RepID=UPI003F6141BB